MPHTPAGLLVSATILKFRATARDRSGSTLGVLVDVSGAPQYLSVIASGEANGTWALSSMLPAGVKPYLLYESTANVLRGGTLYADGRISYQGALYTIESSLDGTTQTAKVNGGD